jgi:hypothetical protein
MVSDSLLVFFFFGIVKVNVIKFEQKRMVDLILN